MENAVNDSTDTWSSHKYPAFKKKQIRKIPKPCIRKETKQEPVCKSQPVFPRAKSDNNLTDNYSALNSENLIYFLPHLPPHLKVKVYGEDTSRNAEVPKPLSVQTAVQYDNKSIAIVAGRGEKNKFIFHAYLFDRGIWSFGQEIPTIATPKSCAISYNQSLYFIGGEQHGIKCENIVIHNVKTNETRYGPPLRVPRCYSGIGRWKNKIYVLGGLNRLNHSMTLLDAYDIDRDCWIYMRQMKFNRYRPGVVVSKGNIYVIGGYTVHCEVFSVDTTNSWYDLPKLPDFFKDFPIIATSFKDLIIAFRNFRPDRIAILNNSKDLWDIVRIKGSLPDEIKTSATHEGSCYVVTTKAKIYEFNFEELTWYECVNCPKNLTTVFNILCINL